MININKHNMKDNRIQTFTNLDLLVSEKRFSEEVKQDFIDDSFIDQVEWAMIMIQSKMKQMFHADHIREVKMSSFDKSYLIASGVDEVASPLIFFKGFDSLQATPNMFPNLNFKIMTIGGKSDDSIVYLSKTKELSLVERRGLYVPKRYAIDYSFAFFNQKTESFYADREGFSVNDKFFHKDILTDGEKITDLISPISLKPGYRTFEPITWYSEDLIDLKTRNINMSYQIALTMFYEWSLYIKEYNNIGIIIPISPAILSEIYNTSMLNFEDRKRMLHFVREHYRRKPMSEDNDYSIYVQKYLRGEYKFNYRGFSAEIIPPKYDLNRINTRKKFIDPYK